MPSLPVSSSPNRLIDLKQAAEYIGLSRSALYRLVKQRAIAFVLVNDKPGHNHRIYFRAIDLDAWVDARLQPAMVGVSRPPAQAHTPLPMPAKRHFS